MFDGIPAASLITTTMFAGDTKRIDVIALDEAGVIVNLTGASITWQIARTNDGPALFSKTLGTGIVVVNAAAGSLEVTLDGADTEGLGGRFYHEIEVIDATGHIATVLAGHINIVPTIIRHDGVQFPDPPPPADSFEAIARKAGDTALAAAIAALGTPLQQSTLAAALIGLLASLPTTLPGASNQLWLNGGALALS